MNFFSYRPFENFGAGTGFNSDPEPDPGPGSDFPGNDFPPEPEGPEEPGISYFGNDAGPFVYPAPPALDNFFGNAGESTPDPEPASTSFFGNTTPAGTFVTRGSVSSSGDRGTPDDSLSSYHFLTLTPGQEYSISALREEYDLDPALWLFEGHRSYQDFLDSGTLADDNEFSSSTTGYLGWADDEIDHPGPHEDALLTFTAPESGRVTAVVTNFSSGPDDGGDGRFDYRLEVQPGDDVEEIVIPSFFGNDAHPAEPVYVAGTPGFFGNFNTVDFGMLG